MVKIVVANLEIGMPTANEACLRLDYELRQAQQQGADLLKVIHGYGSRGVGGALRDAIQAALRRKQDEHQISAFVAGENWRLSDETTWAIVKKFRDLKDDRDLGRGNKGISIVVL
ncbi:MAG: Smr/MutS family protein [Terriglobales bacterium]